jgi:hypothetical protein
MKDRERAVKNCIVTLTNSKVQFDETKRTIQKGNYGIGTWAAIDCLTHYHGWILTS